MRVRIQVEDHILGDVEVVREDLRDTFGGMEHRERLRRLLFVAVDQMHDAYGIDRRENAGNA